MKYSKEWKSFVSEMPHGFQEACLNYKQWKTRCKQLNMGEALVLLSLECNKVEAVFNDGYQVWRHPPSLLACMVRDAPPSSNPNTLLTFANANAKTVYKICKKLRKTNDDPTPMKWLTSIRASHEFNFLGGHHTRHLELCKYGRHVECPICFESVHHKHMLIYQCGHNACIPCTLRYANVKEKGMWYHLLPHANRQHCPYCHYEKAFVNASTLC